MKQLLYDLEQLLFRISVLTVLNHAALDVRFLRSSLVQETVVTTVLTNYRSGTVNLKSFIGKVLLQIKQKFELN